MHKIGVSFRTNLSADEVREKYIEPLRTAVDEASAGVYANHLRQVDPDSNIPTEHLLIFEVNDFKPSLRILRMTLQNVGMPKEVQFHNLNPSHPGY